MVFWSALALMLVLEGALYAIFPQTMQRIMREVIAQSPETLRRFGLALTLIGFVIIWFLYRH